MEIIIVDNKSTDYTIRIAKKFNSKVLFVDGKPPQVCLQRNLGARKAKGEYLFFLDHDMELSKNLLKNFLIKVKKSNNQIDAWYIPEKIHGNNSVISKIRTFERSFYNGTVIDATRIIKKKKFWDTNDKYDVSLSGGPADWDLDIQLNLLNCKFGILNDFITHHEESLHFWQYIFKKTKYLKGINIYKKKWEKKNNLVQNKVLQKQFGFNYRYIEVFLENKKWKKLISQPHLTIGMYFLRLLIGLNYLLNVVKK